MKRTAVWTAVIALAITSAVFAQKKPDFSGTWTLDRDKSEMPQMGGGGGRPGGGGMGGGQMGDMIVTIKQTADAISLEQKMGDMNTRTLTYKLDGSESVNQGMRGGEAKSTTKWDGDKLVTETTQTMSGPNGEMTMKSKEIRSLDPDGTMHVEVTRESPRGTSTSKLVFKKTT